MPRWTSSPATSAGARSRHSELRKPPFESLDNATLSIIDEHAARVTARDEVVLVNTIRCRHFTIDVAARSSARPARLIRHTLDFRFVLLCELLRAEPRALGLDQGDIDVRVLVRRSLPGFVCRVRLVAAALVLFLNQPGPAGVLTSNDQPFWSINLGARHESHTLSRTEAASSTTRKSSASPSNPSGLSALFAFSSLTPPPRFMTEILCSRVLYSRMRSGKRDRSAMAGLAPPSLHLQIGNRRRSELALLSSPMQLRSRSTH